MPRLETGRLLLLQEALPSDSDAERGPGASDCDPASAAEASRRRRRRAVSLGAAAVGAALLVLGVSVALGLRAVRWPSSDDVVGLIAAPVRRCHTASSGEPCFVDVQWARQLGIRQHPAWYQATCPSLQMSSSFEEFQACVFKINMTTCPLPCNPAGATAHGVIDTRSEPGHADGHQTPCHVAVKGESCFDNVLRVMEAGGADKYPALTEHSTFEEIQAVLHDYPEMNCPPPCECHTAEEGETCYEHVMWAINEGFRTHPEWYPHLPLNSSFEEVQTYLRKENRQNCPTPCGPRRAGAEEHRSRQPGAPPTARPPKRQGGTGGSTPAEVAATTTRAASPTPPAKRAAAHTSTTEAEIKAKLHGSGEKHQEQAEHGSAEPGSAHARYVPGRESSRPITTPGGRPSEKPSAKPHSPTEPSPERPSAKAVEHKAGAEKAAVTTKGTGRAVPHHYEQPCHTAREGDPCWKDLMFAVSEGIFTHPEWYPNLTEFSSMEEFQAVLHQNPTLKCTKPCPCHTAQLGDKCYENINWVVREGIAAHPEWYETLTVRSRFEDVQRRLHEDVHSPCGIPCTPKVWGTPSLFCFSIFRSQGYELELVRVQVDRGVGIFRCDEFAVLSDAVLDVAKGIKTTLIPPCESVGVSKDGTAANTLVFMQAWGVVFQDARWRAHDWVIKADPDAVVLVDRMRAHLLPHTGKNTWITNCMKYQGPGWPMMFGSLEAFSSQAMETYYAGAHRCRDELQWQAWGEDLFMGNCLSMLGATSTFDGSLIGDNVCTGANCGDGSSAAYHPFKSVDAWFQCYNQATLR